MANLKEIRSRMKSVKTTQQLTKAMKMVAAAKLRRAQDNIIRLRPYALKLKEIIENIRTNLGDNFNSPFAQEREVKKILMVVVTSNRGLAGPFNANVIKLASAEIKDKYYSHHTSGNLKVLGVGKKGFEFFNKRGFSMVGKNHDLFSKLEFDAASEVADVIMNGFLNKEWDKVYLVYNEFKNAVVQNKVVEQFLPIKSNTIASAEGKTYKRDYIFEPEEEEILADLIPKMLKTQFFKSVLESNASEHGARMTAMDNATENAQELLGQLKLTYNRARQASITNEILEIVGGANALASS